MKRIFLSAALLLAGLAEALAQQSVTRVGPITLGDCASFQSPNSIQDGGIPCGVGHFANPTGAVGLTVVNGAATTSMRSDAAPPLSASVQSALTATVNQLLIGTGAFGFSPTTTGTGALSALGIAVNASGGIVTPTPTRAGDIIYWNGSTWVTLAGNNSGTQTLTENASGVPSWSAAGSGTVTNVATAGLATGGPITTTGTVTVTAAVKADQTTATSNTVAVTPGVQQFHPSAEKAWFRISTQCTTGTCTLGDSYNITSVVHNGTGDYTVTFTTAFATANYLPSCMAQTASLTNGQGVVNFAATTQSGALSTNTTTAVRLISANGSTGAVQDNGNWGCMFVGTQ